MSTDGRTVVAHVALALSAHSRRTMPDGTSVPLEVGEPAALLVEAVSTGQDRPGCAVCAAGGEGGRMAPELLTLDDVSASLQLSERSVRRLTSSGALPSVEVGGAVRVRRADLEAYIAALPTRPSFRAAIRTKDAPGTAASAATSPASADLTRRESA